MPIDLRIEGDRQLVAAGEAFRRLRKNLSMKLLEEGKRFGLDVVASAKRNYLSGPRPNKLGVVTGRLRSSPAAETRLQRKDVITTIGTNVEYAAAHELGFRGMLKVPAHTRVMNKVFGRSIPPTTVKVGGHSRKMNIKPRPFIRPAIEDNLEGYGDSIKRILSEITLPEVPGGK